MKDIVRNKTRSSRTNQRETAHPRPGSRNPDVDARLPMLRTSERGTFKRCRWKWWYEFEETLKPKTDVPPLRFGSLIHLALAAYYIPGTKRGANLVSTFQEAYEKEIEDNSAFGVKDDDVWYEAGDLGTAMLENYLKQYGADTEWEVLMTEQPFQQIVKNPVTFKPWFVYVGIIDGIWRNRLTKHIRIVDHKTTRAIVPQYLALDDQATAYWTFGLDWIYEKGILKPNEKPDGMLYNFLRKAAPDDRPVNEHGEALNQDGSVSKRQAAPFFARIPIYRDMKERENLRHRVLEEFADMAMIRRERAGYYKNPGQFTCPGCWLFDTCELHESGHNYQEMLDFASRSWNPYAEHEIYYAETK